MKYLPNYGDEFNKILSEIGVKDADELFKSIPDDLKLKKPLDIPKAKSEIEVLKILNRLSENTASVEKVDSFLGAGAYNHYIPTVVPALISRSEFYTAYTPYQPEISQGTLQAMFEYQTMMCRLLNMDVANASLYDGGSACAEAVLMADRIQRKKNKIIISEGLHPEYIETIETYLVNLPLEIEKVSLKDDGTTDLDKMKDAIDDNTAFVFLQSPNFFGNVEDLEIFSQIAKDGKTLSGVAISEVYTLGMLKPPGDYDIDIAVGEAQSFGNALNYGGPYLGFIATRDKYIRQLPGRLVGLTKDNRDQRGFVITLSTREQHIRREKATSNICTNEALCATMAGMHLCTLGEQGVKEVALHCHSKAVYAREQFEKQGKVSFPFGKGFFNEFVIDIGKNGVEIVEKLSEEGLIPGFPLVYYYPERANELLLAFTEMNTKEQIDKLVETIGGAI